MNGYAIDLREFFFHAIFEGGGDVVDLGDGQRAFHGAVAGDVDVMFDLACADVVAIHEFVEFRGQAVDEVLDGAGELLHFADAGVGSGDVAPQRLDVNVYFDEAVAHPHNAARGAFVNVDGVTQPAPAPRYSRSDTAAPRMAGKPESRAILEEAGFDDSEIVALGF